MARKVAASAPESQQDAARDTIRHIVRLPGGGAAYASEDPGWGRIGPDGRVLRISESEVVIRRPGGDEALKLYPQDVKRASGSADEGK